ncbi:hypothetical protein Tco_1244162 [Tanacetum coccineum]
MSSDSASSEVTYTSISSHGDPLAWVVDFFRLQEPEAAPESPDYVLGPEEPEQGPLSPYYVPGPEYPEYLALSDEEDSEDGPVDYPADGGNDDDDDSSDDDEEEEEASEEEEDEEEEEEHLALANSVVAPVADHVPSSEEAEPFETDESAATPPSPPACHTTARISIQPEAHVLLPPEEEVERLLALPIPPPSPLISLSPPSAKERIARCLAAPALPSSPLPRLPYPYGSPNHVRAPPGFRAAMGRLRASSPLPPPVPATLPLPSPPLLPIPSSPLPPLLDSLSIPPVDRREDIPEDELPPRKRLCLTTPASRYEVGESSTTVPRPTGGRRVDPRETAEEVAPVTLEGVNTRVTELTAVQEHDTQEIYAVIEDTQDRQTQIYQMVETLVNDSRYHYETARLLDQEALVSQEAWAHSIGFSSAVHYELQGYMTHIWTQDHRMDVQDSLIAALTAQVSSLQGHLATALGEIRALQAREQARADVPEGTGSSS